MWRPAPRASSSTVPALRRLRLSRFRPFRGCPRLRRPGPARADAPVAPDSAPSTTPERRLVGTRTRASSVRSLGRRRSLLLRGWTVPTPSLVLPVARLVILAVPAFISSVGRSWVPTGSRVTRASPPTRLFGVSLFIQRRNLNLRGGVSLRGGELGGQPRVLLLRQQRPQPHRRAAPRVRHVPRPTGTRGRRPAEPRKVWRKVFWRGGTKRTLRPGLLLALDVQKRGGRRRPVGRVVAPRTNRFDRRRTNPAPRG